MVRLTAGSQSSDRPALAAYGTNLYLIWKGTGTDNTLWRSKSTYYGFTWSAPVNMTSFQAEFGPCLVITPRSTGTKQHLFFKKPGSLNIQYTSSTNEGVTWSNVVSLSGQTSDKPAAYVYDGKIHLVWKQSSNSIGQSVSEDNGLTWKSTGTINTANQTISGPSICRFQNKNYLVFRGVDNQLRLARTTTNDTTWGNPILIDGYTSDSPTIIAIDNKVLVMSKGQGTDTQLYVQSSSNGDTWTTQALVVPSSAIRTNVAPAYTFIGGSQHIVYVATDASSTLNHANTSGQGYWNTLPRTGKISSHKPALAIAPNDVLWLFWKGIPGDNNIYRSSTTNNGVTWTTLPRIDRVHKTSSAPAVAISGTNFHLIYRSYFEDALYYLRSTDGGQTWTYFTQLDGYTDDSPTLVAYQDTLYLAWKGLNENKLYWSKSTNNGDSWTGINEFPASVATSGGPTLLMNKYGNRVHLVYRGIESSNPLYYTACADGLTWSTPYLIDGAASSDSPGLSLYNEETILLVWKGPTGDNTVWYSISNETALTPYDWIPPIQLDQGDAIRTSHGPAVVSLSGAVRLVIRGRMGNSDTNIYRVDATLDGVGWTSITKLSTAGAGSKATSNQRPYITSVDNGRTLTAMWKGLNDSYVYMSTSTDFGRTWSNTPTSISTAITTNHQPFLLPAIRGNKQHLYYRATDGYVRHATRSYPVTGDFTILNDGYQGIARDAPVIPVPYNEYETQLWFPDNNGSLRRSFCSGDDMVPISPNPGFVPIDITVYNTPGLILRGDNKYVAVTSGTWDYVWRTIINRGIPFTYNSSYHDSEESSSDAPVVVWNLNKIFVLWKGIYTDTRLYFSTSPLGERHTWTAPIALPTAIGSTVGPSIYSSAGFVYLLYTGVDSSLYSAILPGSGTLNWKTDNYGLSPLVAANWMEQLYDQDPSFKDKKITEILIPGTHQSAHYEGKDFPTSLSCMKKSNKKQNSTIFQQLNRGIRYFDLSFDAVANSTEESDDMKWSFNVTSTSVDLESDVLQPLRDFLTTCKNEIIILHISQWGSGFSGLQGPKSFKAFFEKIHNMIGNYIMPRPSSETALPTIKDILKSGKRVIISVELPSKDKTLLPEKYESYIYDNIASPYEADVYNTTNSQGVKKFIESEFSHFESKKQMWVSKLFLAPELREEFLFRDITHISSMINPKALSWLASEDWKGKVNIVSVDFCWDSLIETIIKLNKGEEVLEKEEDYEYVA